MELPFETELQVRFRDLDTLGHVNNAVYATYLEQARLRYFDRVLDIPWEEREMVLASQSVEFARPLTLDDGTIRVACGVTDIGGSSFRMRSRVLAGDDGDPAATADGTIVAVAGGEPREIPESWRERFVEFEPGL